jgi:hypothetical protein
MDPRYLPTTFDGHLARLIEECAEVIQCCTKIQRFGPENYHPDDKHKISNLAHLHREIADLQSAISGLGTWLSENSYGDRL